MTVVSIQGLDKAEVLASLYNAVKADLEWQKGEEQLTVEDAESLLSSQWYFLYLRGRFLGINLSGDEINTRMYDDAHGYGSAKLIIDTLRESGFRVIDLILPEGNGIQNTSVATQQKLRRIGLL
jgi:hypothetical protein